MAKRGRKSAAQLAVVSLPLRPSAIERVERPVPPNHLGDVERAVWESVVDSLPADWFDGAMLAVLEQYCAHVVEARRLAGRDRGAALASAWTPDFGGPWTIDWEEAI